MQVNYPPDIRKLSAELGVPLEASEEIEDVNAVSSMGSEMDVDVGADFGFGFPKLKAFVKQTVQKNILRPASSGAKPAIIGGSAIAFGIKSPNIKPAAAMAAADRLLGDPKIGNAAAVLRNTKALAALGDPSARRGLTILQAVGKIRAAKQAQPGQKVIPAKAVPARAVTIQRTPAQVRRMATKKVVTAKPAEQPGIVKRVLRFFGFSV